MIYTSKLPSEEYNILIMFSCFFLIYWGLRVTAEFYYALKLRSAVLSGRLVNIPGLGENLHYFDSATRNHISSLIQTRQSSPPETIQNIYIPFSIQSTKLDPVRNMISIDFWTASKCRVYFIERFDVSKLNDTPSFESGEVGHVYVCINVLLFIYVNIYRIIIYVCKYLLYYLSIYYYL